VREIGRRLDVSAIVEGSVRMLGTRLRITAQLVDARDGLHLWSGRFDRTLEDVFEIQDEISLSVVDKLEVELLGREREAVTRRPTDNLDAYNACLRGWYHFNRLTPEDFMLSCRYYDEAIELDPDFAGAYDGLIGWYHPQIWWFELPPEPMLEAVEPLVEKLVEIDNTYLSHRSRAYLDSIYGWDWEAGDEDYRRALELGPNIPETHLMFAQNLIVQERFDEAVPLLRRTRELDPLSPLWFTGANAWLSYAGLHDEALAGVKRGVELHPHHWMPRFCLSVVQAKMARFDEARADAELAFEMSGGLSRPAANLATLSYQTGDVARGDELFEMLEQRARGSWVPPTILGWVHLVRGEIDEAYDRFDEAARRKDPLVSAFRVDSPGPIPDEPRFHELSERLGLPH
jgi:tetratricopeptide (TPR) repeat protein